MTLMEAGTSVLQRLEAAGFEAFFVGGMVRDALLGREIHDVDITTSAMPVSVMGLFDNCVPTGIGHGTVTVLVGKVPIEVTTYRMDGEYRDFRRPESVSFTTSLEEDLRRRDFTINALAMDKNGQVFDPLMGSADLRGGLIRAVGNAGQRFFEDPLRMLRALRFVSKLGFELDNGCQQAIKDYGYLTANLARERVMKELEGLMDGKFKEKALGLMIQAGLLAHFPDLKPLARLDTKVLSTLKNSLDLFLAASFFSGGIKEYMAGWPLSKSQKRLIAKTHGYFLDGAPLLWVQYADGMETAAALWRMRVVFGKSDEAFIPQQLVISNRGELAMTASNMLSAAGISPGPNAKKLLEQVEWAVLSQKIKNSPAEILAFIGGQDVSAKT